MKTIEYKSFICFPCCLKTFYYIPGNSQIPCSSSCKATIGMCDLKPSTSLKDFASIQINHNLIGHFQSHIVDIASLPNEVSITVYELAKACVVLCCHGRTRFPYDLPNLTVIHCSFQFP